jgi:DNA-binding NtrC family response regulator
MLVDLKMPGANGLQVLVAARKRQPSLVAILMMPYATVDTAVQAMKPGAYDYLVKPFDLEELSQLVQRLTRQTALRRREGSTLCPHPIVRTE